MNNSTLVMSAVLAAVAMLSAAVIVIPVQQASANVEEHGDGEDTYFNFKQKQSNRCSGFAFCANEGALTFGF